MHGWGGDRNSLGALADAFSYSYQVVCPDFYGFGQSPHGDKPLFLRDYAQGVLDIIKSNNLGKVKLVGHSFGGRVALFLASNFPEYVESVVLIDSAGILPKRSIKYYIRLAIHKLLVKSRGYGLKGSEDYEKLSNIEKQSFVNIVNEDLSICATKIEKPTLIIWGKDDKATPLYMAKKLNKLIKDSKLLVIDGGHFAYLNCHNECLGAIAYFFKK